MRIHYLALPGAAPQHRRGLRAVPAGGKSVGNPSAAPLSWYSNAEHEYITVGSTETRPYHQEPQLSFVMYHSMFMCLAFSSTKDSYIYSMAMQDNGVYWQHEYN
jgi:hypothetical protein